MRAESRARRGDVTPRRGSRGGRAGGYGYGSRWEPRPSRPVPCRDARQAGHTVVDPCRPTDTPRCGRSVPCRRADRAPGLPIQVVRANVAAGVSARRHGHPNASDPPCSSFVPVEKHKCEHARDECGGGGRKYAEFPSGEAARQRRRWERRAGRSARRQPAATRRRRLNDVE